MSNNPSNCDYPATAIVDAITSNGLYPLELCYLVGSGDLPPVVSSWCVKQPGLFRYAIADLGHDSLMARACRNYLANSSRSFASQSLVVDWAIQHRWPYADTLSAFATAASPRVIAESTRRDDVPHPPAISDLVKSASCDILSVVSVDNLIAEWNSIDCRFDFIVIDDYVDAESCRRYLAYEGRSVLTIESDQLDGPQVGTLLDIVDIALRNKWREIDAARKAIFEWHHWRLNESHAG